MKVFVLEDDSKRISDFSGRYIRDSIIICNNAEDAKLILLTIKFDLIYLDHDLEGRVFVKSEEPNTGYQVAKIIPDTINKETPIILHTLNERCVNKMLSVLFVNNPLANSIWLPFGSTDFFNESERQIKKKQLQSLYNIVQKEKCNDEKI